MAWRNALAAQQVGVLIAIPGSRPTAAMATRRPTLDYGFGRHGDRSGGLLEGRSACNRPLHPGPQR